MPRRKDTPAVDDHVSETDADSDENDENTPLNDENALPQPVFAPVHRSSSVFVLRTPLSHSRASQDTPLRDITDQFFHPPSPSPVRISKLKRSAPHTIEPPRRPKKPKSLAYPADPPNWLYSRSSSSLPPSSPFPPSPANVDHGHSTDHSVARPSAAQYEYNLGTPSRASDSDPFGFFAVERALKAKRAAPALAPHKLPSRLSGLKSPPRSTVLSHPHVFASFSQLDAPVPTNNEDIEGLYADEPVAGPSHVHVPAAPLLLMNSDQPHVQVDGTRSQPTFPDPLRTPRKRKRRVSLVLDENPDPDEEATDIPSSPSPVKVSVGAGRPSHVPSSRIPVPKLTRAQTRAADTCGSATQPAARTKRVKTSYQRIPTPASTPASVRPTSSARQSTAPPTPVPPRRSKRQAAVGARAALKGTTSDSEDGGRMKLRSRGAKANVETKATKPTTRTKPSPSKSKGSTRTQKAATGRGRPRGKASARDTKGIKGKGKARPLEDVLDLSDDAREKYDKERRERLEYFKRLEGYQIQKENVYVV